MLDCMPDLKNYDLKSEVKLTKPENQNMVTLGHINESSSDEGSLNHKIQRRNQSFGLTLDHIVAG